MGTRNMREDTKVTRTAGWCAAAAVAVVACGLIAGCSDDVVCPDLAPQANVYVSAQIVERAGSTPATTVRVAATADPLPSLLAVFVNETQLTDVQAEGLGLLASLDDDVVRWQSGTRCSLQITTNYGFATSGLTVPGAAETRAPSSVAPGETLAVSWTRAEGADYYLLTAFLTESGSRRAGLGPLATEEIFSVATTETVYAYVVPADVSVGVIAGAVDAVAGPYPQSGQGGNISGDAWGFFTSSYGDSGSGFSVQVTLPEAGSSSRSRSQEDAPPPSAQ